MQRKKSSTFYRLTQGHKAAIFLLKFNYEKQKSSLRLHSNNAEIPLIQSLIPIPFFILLEIIPYQKPALSLAPGFNNAM